MSDTNFRYMEVSAQRKKRNQFISVLIIVAIVLLGLIVWGWMELQKNRNAERIKNALNSQVEPGFKEPVGEVAQTVTDSTNPKVQDTVVTEPVKSLEVKEPEPKPVAMPEPLPEPAPTKPALSKAPPKTHVQTHPKNHVKPIPVAKQVSIPEEPKPEIQKPALPKPEKSSPVAVKPLPVDKPAPEVHKVVKEEPPVAVVPPVPTPKPVEPPQPPAAAKAFAPEDLPVTSKTSPSEAVRLAMVTAPVGQALPDVDKVNSETPTGGSASFKEGVAAYRQQDYVNAIRSFSALGKPTSKKRGGIERDEYVQANFLKGLSMLKVGHMSEAVSAFLNVLEFEKYYPLANMNIGICYVEMKQYAKAHQAFEAVIRDQSFIEPAVFDDVMQRTKYFWALAWTRLYKHATNPDKQVYYRQQAILKWKDYEVWFSKNEKYKNENLKAENYLKSLSNL